MKRFLYFHPFFFGVYPVVALLGHNVAQAYRLDALRPFLLMLSMTVILWAVLGLVYQNWTRGALATSFLLFLFLVHENLSTQLSRVTLPSLPISLVQVLGIVWGGLALFGLWWMGKGVKNPLVATQFFFTIGLVALAIPVFQIVSFDLEKAFYSSKIEFASASAPPLSEDREYPDIYFIVLDAYARDDILTEEYGFDNTPFLSSLEDMGFYVPTCNQSNYSKTAFSIATTLNLDYLDVLGGGSAYKAVRNKYLIRDNEVRRILTQWGYTTVAFPTGLWWSVMDDADVFLTPEQDNLRKVGPWQPLAEVNPFELLLLQTSFHTPLAWLTASGVTEPLHEGSLEAAIEEDVDRQKYDRVQFALDALERIPYIPGPKFVYAHIVSPHPPYLMNRAGEFDLTLKGKKAGYIEQMIYLNERLLPILQGILDHSDTPPIIILEGDHGTKRVEWTPDIVKNLSAYYFPDGGSDHLYNTITPVNLFRIILDHYFGTDYGTVEDISYRSLTDDHQLDMELVPNTCTR